MAQPPRLLSSPKYIYLPSLPSYPLPSSYHSHFNTTVVSQKYSHFITLSNPRALVLFVMYATIVRATTANSAAVPVDAHITAAQVPANNNGGSGLPQCCHCGWRGSHAPNCPFR